MPHHAPSGLLYVSYHNRTSRLRSSSATRWTALSARARSAVDSERLKLPAPGRTNAAANCCPCSGGLLATARASH